MRRQLTLLLLLASLLPGQIFSQSTPKYNGAQRCSQRKSSLPGNKYSVFSPNTPKHKFDVLKYTINVDIYNCFKGSYPNSFTGSVIVQFRVDSLLNSIDLNAAENSIVVDSVSMAGMSFSHAANILTVNLNQYYQPGDTAAVKVNYHHLDVYDHAFFASGGFVFTDCEPEGARKWFPCWDKPSDKALLDLTARTPSNVKLGSNGALVDSVKTGDTIYYHWVTRDPISTYLIVMSAKVNYHLDIVYWTNPNIPGATPVPFRFYFNDGEDPTQMELLISDVCDYFSTAFCDHPFEKNGFATLNNQFTWGGMENQTLTNLCPFCWDESLIVHEFAHQWFGDMITCGTWADIFLNEGFATYLEALWYEHSSGYSSYKSSIDAEANDYLSDNPGWPISQPAWAMNTPPNSQLFYYSITYAKGACVLHQLRYVMGDSLFFAGMKSYANDSANLKYQNALIPDFQQHMEQAYGQNLDWFFDEWIYEPNHPVYANTYSIVNLGSGNWKVGFFTRQTQTDPSFFKMPIQIRVRFTDNSDTIIRVMNDIDGQAYSFYFSKQPNQVTFDPGNLIVLKQASTVVGLQEYPGLPQGYSLSQNNPNPADEKTVVNYSLPEKAFVKVSLYSITGHKIADLENSLQLPGEHTLEINTCDYSSGVYLYKFEANGYSQAMKMVINR